jgi:transcriptional regulator with XRE-family HTH domain
MRRSIYSEAYGAFVDQMIEARKSAGMTQAQVAAKLGKPQSFVSKYESHERRLDVVEFILIARLLKADPLKIIGATEAVQGMEIQSD